jgi:hypothetical protein
MSADLLHASPPVQAALLSIALIEGQIVRHGKEYSLANWEVLRQALAAMPLSTDEYGKAINRFCNALSRYFAHELGECQGELRLLKGVVNAQR